MKRNFLMIALSTAFLAVTSVVAWLLGFVSLEFGACFGIGVGLLVLGIALLIFVGKSKVTKFVVAVVNAISMGFFLRSWYINRGFENSIWLMLAVVGMATAYFVVAILPMLLPAIYNNRILYLVMFVILSILVYIYLVVSTKTTWVSTLGYFGLIQIGFAICLCLEENVSVEKTLVASTYTVAICAVIILVIVLSLNDGSSIFDGIDFPSGKGGQRVKPKAQKKDIPQPPEV